jgi:uncharacterized pyridoxal phosphate-containing UPF0001 family protein
VTAAPTASVVAARLDDVRRRIRRAGRDPAGVRVIAVTKGFGPDAVAAACAAGVRDIGENYAAELLAKAADIARMATDIGTTRPTDPIDHGDHVDHGDHGGHGRAALVPHWHFLGAVQRRRVRDLAPVVDCWQSLARAVEGEAIAAHAPGAKVLVQVDTAGLPGRNGCPPADVPHLVRSLQVLGLDVQGLMVVAPPGGLDVARAAFAVVARLAADLGLRELSMGMSGDLEAALSEGATMVRVGRALFGDRPARHTA